MDNIASPCGRIPQLVILCVQMMQRLAEEQQTARHESRGDLELLFPGSCAVSKEGSDFSEH